jgi:hypothetical protein
MYIFPDFLSPPLLQSEYERRLNPRRDDQERKHDSEVSPEGMLYMESEECAFLATYSPGDRHPLPATGKGEGRIEKMD